MNRLQRRSVAYLLVLFGAVGIYSLAYHFGMRTAEGEQVAFLHSLQVVVETFTTTGFGSDAPWTTPEMNLLVILMDISGIVLIFLALPVLMVPLLRETLTTTAPTRVTDRDHVVICGFTARGEELTDELSARGVSYVVVEPDRDRAADVYESEKKVIHADPESMVGLERASVRDARAIVADVDDETNASIALAADGVEDLLVVTFAEDPDVVDYHRYAGADQVFSPRHLVGESLARQVTAGVTTALAESIEIDGDFEVAELPVQADSDLAGRTIADSGIRETTGVNVIGAWFRGEFESPPAPEALVDEQTILLVAGREEQLERLKEMTLSERRGRPTGNVVIAGYGEVGQTVAETLEAAGFARTVVDIEPMDGVDVVGDVTDTETLQAAGIDEAGTVIIALHDDTHTVFATLVVREVAPDVEILTRADATGSVSKLYRAGADYVLALATVSGRMLASTILGEDVLTFDQQVEVVEYDAGDLAGRTIDDADVRARTDCTIIAVRREGDLHTDVEPGFRIQADDRLVVTGTNEGIKQFTELVE